MTKQQECINAELIKIVFSNDSGFIIGSFKNIDHQTQTTMFTATGTIVNAQIGTEYILIGEYKVKPKYGEQFVFTRFETIIPDNPAGIFKYLVRTCKYVGSTTGQALVDAYGADAIKMLKSNPTKVADEINGITLKRATEIQQILLTNEVSEKTMVELEALLDVQGILKNLPTNLYKDFNSNAPAKIKQNPYFLTKYRGVGFPMADRVALNIGFSRTSIERKKAACVHCLRENEQQGSTWILRSELLKNMMDLLQIVELEKGIQALIEQGTVILDNDYVAYKSTAQEERIIAEQAVRMNALIRNMNQEEQVIKEKIAA